MPSLAESAATVQFDAETFDAVSDRAYHALGACDGRFAKAVALARSGAVHLLPNGQATVDSQEDGGEPYAVNGACACPDAQYRADNGHCKHVIATWIMRRVAAVPRTTADNNKKDVSIRLPSSRVYDVNSTTPAVTAPPVLPEAPASCNCHITIAGRQVQVTLRDSDETRLLQRLTDLLSHHPLPESPVLPSHTAQEPREGFCPIHSLQMRQTTKEGRTWWSHKLADGSWCKGKRQTA